MLSDDTRLWWATRLQKAAQRVASGPQPRIPDGTQLVDSETLSALVAQAMGDEEKDDEPLDPQEMRIRNLSISQIFNDGVEPAVIHAGSVRKALLTEGFSEETAEHLAGHIFIMAAQGIMGVEDDSDYE